MPIAKKLPSGNYRALVYVGKDEGGKRQYKSFTSPDKWEAENMANQYRKKQSQDAAQTITIGEAVESYIESKRNVLSPSTIQGYESIEEHRLDGIKNIVLFDMTSQQMQIYINELSSRLSAKTVSNTYGLISSAIKHFAPNLHITITLPQKKKNIRQMPQPKEVINAIKGSRVELPALLAMWLSLRMSEVRGLKYGDVQGDYITVQRTVLTVNGEHLTREQTKTVSSTRRLHLHPYLKALIGKGAKDEHIVKETAEVTYKRFVKAIDNAGLPHMRFHDLRHMNASVMVQLGIPDKYAMERGGWSTNSTLQGVYQHTFTDERKVIDERIDNFFSNLISDDAT